MIFPTLRFVQLEPGSISKVSQATLIKFLTSGETTEVATGDVTVVMYLMTMDAATLKELREFEGNNLHSRGLNPFPLYQQY